MVASDVGSDISAVAVVIAAFAEFCIENAVTVSPACAVESVPVTGPLFIIVTGVKSKCTGKSLDVVGAFGSGGTIPCLLQSGQEHGGENGDDSNDDQKLNQGESSFLFHGIFLSFLFLIFAL